MKKVLLLISFTFAPLALSAQWSGDGLSPATAYYGVINTANPMQEWNTANYPGGVIYVGQPTSGWEDLTIGSGGSLTIQQGITVKFCTTLSDLRITGTGILNAQGSPSNLITFTKNVQANWGHISFESMTTTNPENYPSVLSNCVIQWGNVSSTSLLPANPNQYGGAIHIDFSYVTVSGCELSNNKAGWGGSIFVGDGKSPSMSNCYVHDNTATTSGGGLYFWKNSSPVITNSIVTYNNCPGTGGGGGIFVGGAAKGVKVINCTISHNTANSQSLGYNIKIFNNTATPKPQFINSIIWYPANSIVGSTYSSDFLNCAIQDPPLTTYTGYISLNSANEGTNPTGPFFASMSGSSWPLQFRSPCRDAGTTPSPAVPADYSGNPRVFNYDMGAYEYQYSRWKTTAGSTDWNTSDNWYGGIPTSTLDVLIPTGAPNYPTTPPGADFTIGSGKQMIVEPGARATINRLTNNGSLKMNANASGLSSLILNSYSKGAGATEEIQLRITGGYVGAPELNQGKWHYISSPVQNFPVDPVFTTTTYNLAQWVDGIQGAQSIREGWVAYDGYIYITNGYNPAYGFTGLTPGKGYNLWYNNDTIYTLSGNLNSANVPVTLSFAGDAYTNGYNLLGNPFPSGLDWDYIVENTNNPYPQNTSQGIIFTKDDELYYYTGGVMVPDIGVPGTSPGVIPPMQGFFIKTYSTGNIINLTPDARTHDAIPPRYKGKAEVPLLRLAISENNVTDETVVRFAENAKPGIDYAYDAVKMITSTQKTAIYTSYGTYNFAINGQPFPDAETFIEIPLIVNLISDGNHVISLKQLQALDKYGLSLVDKSTGFSVDLSTSSSLAFSSSKGLITDRFVIKISNISTGIENPENGENQFNIYNGSGLINIQTIADEWNGRTGSVKVMDMSGKIVSDLRRTEFSKTSVTQIKAPDANGLYLIEIKSGPARFVGKVVVK